MNICGKIDIVLTELFGFFIIDKEYISFYIYMQYMLLYNVHKYIYANSLKNILAIRNRTLDLYR